MFLVCYKKLQKQIVFCTILVVFIFTLFPVNAQDENAVSFGEVEKSEYYFGFNLMETLYGSLFHLGLIKNGEDGRQKVKFITLDDFLWQASGKVKSVANPNRVNFFKEYNIKNPVITLSGLWKLRYREMPYGMSNEKGWANYADTSLFTLIQTQKEILKKYGMNRLKDFIVGENAFKLLKNMEDSIWIKKYTAGTAEGPN